MDITYASFMKMKDMGFKRGVLQIYHGNCDIMAKKEGKKINQPETQLK